MAPAPWHRDHHLHAAWRNGIEIRVICGDVAGTKGPVQDIVIDPQYLDVSVPPSEEFIHAAKRGHTVFAFILKVAFEEYSNGTFIKHS